MAWIPTYETSVMEEDLNNYKTERSIKTPFFNYIPYK